MCVCVGGSEHVCVQRDLGGKDIATGCGQSRASVYENTSAGYVPRGDATQHM